MKRINKNILKVLPETIMAYITFAIIYFTFRKQMQGNEYLMIIPFIILTIYIARDNRKEIRKISTQR